METQGFLSRFEPGSVGPGKWDGLPVIAGAVMGGARISRLACRGARP